MKDYEQLIKLKERIPFEEGNFENETDYETMLKALLEDSRSIALSEIYPFEDWYDMELPKKYKNWQLRACIELYNRAGMEGIVSYSENGLSWKRSTDLLSNALVEQLISRAAAPKRGDINE